MVAIMSKLKSYCVTAYYILTGASPAKLLFGNKLDLNRQIITPFQLPEEVISNSKYVTDLVNVQDEVLKAAVENLSAAKNKRHGKNTKKAIVFPIDSYVLAKYNDLPPPRLYTKWHGLFVLFHTLIQSISLLS